MSPKSGFRRHRGFTLLEVTIVAAILVILAMIAYPSYQGQIRKSRRASAQSHLMDIATHEQQYLFDRRAYAADLAALNITTAPDIATQYTIAIVLVAGPPPSFTISAAPRGTQALDLGGAPLTLDNTGAKTPAAAW